MTQRTPEELQAKLVRMAESHARSNEIALIEHARMGRSVPEWREGAVVWISPEEIFARYGLNEHGKPKS